MQTLPRQRTERGSSIGPEPGCRQDWLEPHCLIPRDNFYLNLEFIANISKFCINIIFTTSLKNLDSLTTSSLYSCGAIISWTT